MKISIITVSNNEVTSSEKNDVIKLISSQLFKNGFEVFSNQILKAKHEIVTSALNSALENNDCVIFVSDNDFEKAYFCKKIISDIFKSDLTVNDFAKKKYRRICKNFKQAT